MADDIETNAQGLQTDLSLPGDPTTQSTAPNPDVIVVTDATWDQTANTVILNGNKYSLTLIGPVS